MTGSRSGALLFGALFLVAACGSSVDADDKAAAGGGGGTGGGGSGPCASDADCPSEQGCFFDDAACTTGHCTAFVLSDCGPGYPICRCDGTLDPAACELTMGHQVTTDTSCFPATFMCGPSTCQKGVESCSSVPGPSAQHSCQPLSDACKAPGAGCDCFGDLGLGCSCSQDEYGNFQVGCSG